MTDMTHADIVIDAFGGTTELARLIKAPTSTVHSWRKIGIPDSRMAHLQLLAQVRAVVLPGDHAVDDTVADDPASATKSDEIICDTQEADSHAAPFSGAEAATVASCATCSPTNAPLPSSAASPTSLCSSEATA